MARTRVTSKAEVRPRLEYAVACLQVAELVLDDAEGAMPGVAAGLAVLAGVAASDVICAVRLGKVHRGESHRDAAELLASATGDGRKLGETLRKLRDIKDEAHYGLVVVAPRRARDAIRWAGILIEAADREFGR